jgi:hypothetical protein
MKEGDLVRHNQTKVIGILLEVLDDPSVPAPIIYNVYWSDTYSCINSSHFIEEIEVISESR